MAENRYIVTRSNYSIRKRHKVLSDGNIYARDYMVTSPTSFDLSSFTYPNSNFKFVKNPKSQERRFHSYGDWISCNGDSSTEYWTSECLVKTDDKVNKITLKEKYSSLLDFSYYGSCSEMVKSKISEIINNFPSELYVTGIKATYWTDTKENRPVGENISEDVKAYLGDIKLDTVEIGDLVLIDNPFNIDITYEVPNKKSVERDFCNSYRNYNILYGDSIKENKEWSVLYKCNGCYNGQLTSIILVDSNINGGKFIIYEYYLGDRGYVLTCDKKFKNVRVRPNDNTVEAFYDSIDELGRFLLNRESKPIYTCNMYHHRETEYGIVKTRRNFTWPSTGGWNLCIDGGSYERYVKSLLTLSELYDEIYTNNFVRMMTHEAIKNMDLTKGVKSSDNDTDYIYGTTKFMNMLNVIACFFDGIKLKIDNIGRVNTITYNEENNIPDYFLTDKLNNLGWEIVNPTNNLENVDTCVEYGSERKDWSLTDVSNRFFNNLVLNSKQIVMKKGTKSGIESLLNLFGLKSYEFTENCKKHGLGDIEWDYKLEEYIQVAKPNEKLKSVSVEEIEKMNSLKDTYEDGGYIDDYEDTLQGLPVLMVSFYKEGRQNKYLIPWFKGVYEIDGNPYYQMYGGWGKRYRKTNRRKNMSEVGVVCGDMVYEETYKRLIIVSEISSLTEIPISKLHDGIVVYVHDVTNYNKYFTDAAIKEEISNYFVLNDKEYSGVFYTTETGKGWRNISNTEISKPTNDGFNVLYLENIIDENRGNNPHLGYGIYDNGDEYYEYFKKIFKGAIDNDVFIADAYDCEDGRLNDTITKSGFVLTQYMDNMKCRYYTDNNNKTLKRFTFKESDHSKKKFKYEIETSTNDNVAFTNDYYQDVETRPYDFEYDTDDNNITESSANSIINTKIFKVIFRKKGDESKDEYAVMYRNFLENSVLPYLMQIVPSTSVCTFMIDGDDVDIDKIKKNTPIVCGVTD